MDRYAADYDRMTRDAEDAGTEACGRAAKIAGLKPKQAEDCDDGEHGCFYCPWRNPFTKPARGDSFKLASGREIYVHWVNMEHTVRPELEYIFARWSRWDGGRAAYRIAVSSWPRLVKGAKLLCVGLAVPKGAMTIRESPKAHADRVAAFGAVNSAVSLSRWDVSHVISEA